MAVLAGAAAVAWAPGAWSTLPAAWWLALMAGSVLAVGAAWQVSAVGSDAPLHWDGRQWALGEPGRLGRLSVALDAGAGMLLRFDPQSGSGPLRRRWIPVGRRSAGSGWHALRCAVYSPRPGPGGHSAAASPASSE
ncbi:MAG: hypothetical protein KF788_16065 [Piscinibacter sp.]|nr:hypothetical protein [Piscinibacter sp.]